MNKVSKSISIIYRASQKLNETALLMLYNTLILPYSSYCSAVSPYLYNKFKSTFCQTEDFFKNYR